MFQNQEEAVEDGGKVGMGIVGLEGSEDETGTGSLG